MPAVRSLVLISLLASSPLFGESIERTTIRSLPATETPAGAVSSEFPLSPAVMQPSSGAAPRVAAGENGYFVTWADYRDPVHRLTLRGTALDTDGSPIGGGRRFAGEPLISWVFPLGEGFGVIGSGLPKLNWIDQTLHRLSADGTESEPSRKLPETPAGYFAGSTGERFALYRYDSRSTTSFLQIFDAAGDVVARSNLASPNPSWGVQEIDTAASNLLFAVVKTERRSTSCRTGCYQSRMQYVTPQGTTTIPAVLYLGQTNEERTVIAVSGELTLIFLTPTSNNGKPARAFLADWRGVVAGPLNIVRWWHPLQEPKIIWDGATDFVVAAPPIAKPDSIVARRISASPLAAPAEPFTLIESGVNWETFDLTARAGTLFAVHAPGEIEGIVIPAAATPRERVTVSYSAAPQQLLGVADGPSVDLVLWSEPGGVLADGRLLVSRVDARGRALDGTGILVDRYPQQHDVYSDTTESLAAAWNGSHFVIAWIARDTLYTRTLSDQGEWLVETRTIAPAVRVFGHPLAIVRTDSNLLVFWNATAGFAASRLDDSGAPLDPAPIVLDGSIAMEPTAATFDGYDVIVAWTRYCSDLCNSLHRMARVSSGGLVLENIPLFPPPNTSSAAALGETALLAWTSTAGMVHATRVRNGQALDLVDESGNAAILVRQTDAVLAVTVVPRDGKFLVVYGAERLDGMDHRILILDPERPLREQLASSPLFSIGYLPEFNRRGWAQRVALAAGQGNSAILVYMRHADEPQYGGVPRIFVRTLGVPARIRGVRR